jgi:hypothetical protein
MNSPRNLTSLCLILNGLLLITAPATPITSLKCEAIETDTLQSIETIAPSRWSINDTFINPLSAYLLSLEYLWSASTHTAPIPFLIEEPAEISSNQVEHIVFGSVQTESTNHRLRIADAIASDGSLRRATTQFDSQTFLASLRSLYETADGSFNPETTAPGSQFIQEPTSISLIVIASAGLLITRRVFF